MHSVANILSYMQTCCSFQLGQFYFLNWPLWVCQFLKHIFFAHWGRGKKLYFWISVQCHPRSANRRNGKTAISIEIFHRHETHFHNWCLQETDLVWRRRLPSSSNYLILVFHILLLANQMAGTWCRSFAFHTLFVFSKQIFIGFGCLHNPRWNSVNLIGAKYLIEQMIVGYNMKLETSWVDVCFLESWWWWEQCLLFWEAMISRRAAASQASTEIGLTRNPEIWFLNAVFHQLKWTNLTWTKLIEFDAAILFYHK